MKTKTKKVASKIEPKKTRKIFVSRGDETALMTLARKCDYKAKSYPIGEFVTSVCGVDAPRGEFWKLRVGGQDAKVGASKNRPGAGRRIEWKIEEIER